MALFTKDSPPTRPAIPNDPPKGSGSSYLGPHIVFDGTVTGNENLVIEGTVRGKIDLKSDLRVGPTARVEATVHAKNVAIEGTLVGDVSADGRVELVASANVDGNIKAPKVIVAEGARFRGAVDMGSAKPQGDEKKPDKA